VSATCNELVGVDHANPISSDNKWTAKLESDDQHWLTIFKERLTVLKNGSAN
jgi:hypothetical protein